MRCESGERSARTDMWEKLGLSYLNGSDMWRLLYSGKIIVSVRSASFLKMALHGSCSNAGFSQIQHHRCTLVESRLAGRSVKCFLFMHFSLGLHSNFGHMSSLIHTCVAA